MTRFVASVLEALPITLGRCHTERQEAFVTNLFCVGWGGFRWLFQAPVAFGGLFTGSLKFHEIGRWEFLSSRLLNTRAASRTSLKRSSEASSRVRTALGPWV